MMPAVVVTGMGLVTPLGRDCEQTWSGLMSGRSGIEQLELPELPGVNWIGGRVPDFSVQAYVKDQKAIKTMTRQTQLAVAAAKMACDQAGVSQATERGRMGVYLGAGFEDTSLEEIAPAMKASMDGDGSFSLKKFGKSGYQQLSPLFGLRKLPNMALSHVSIAHGVTGPNALFSPSVAAGLQAVAEGFDAIRRNSIDMALVGGCDAKVDLNGFLRYGTMSLLSARAEARAASRPFDRRRDGIVLGEGAAFLLIEAEAHARARGATPLATIAGFGTAFANPATDKARAVRALRQAMERALIEAEVSAGDVDYVLANGASTTLHDDIEYDAIQQLLGDDTAATPVGASKSMLGHLVTAAGAIDVALCAKALERQSVPPTLNLDAADPSNRLRFVTTAQPMSMQVALVNAIGFEGTYASLVLKKPTASS